MMLSAYLHNEVFLALTAGAIVDDKGNIHTLIGVGGEVDAVSDDFVRIHVAAFSTADDNYDIDKPIELVVPMRHIASCQLLAER